MVITFNHIFFVSNDRIVFIYQKWYNTFNDWREKMIGNIVKVIVDRPLGSYHPVYQDMYYPINYGYIKGILAPDGEEQDAYILGVDHPVETFTGKVIAIIHRYDDVEEKWVVAPMNKTYTLEEIQKQVTFQERYFNYEIKM